MFRNILLISVIFVIVLFLSWLIDLGGHVTIIVSDYKITTSAIFFTSSLIALYFIFYLIFSFILRVNYLRTHLKQVIYYNPARLEKKLIKEQKSFISKISHILKEINNKNLVKAIKLEKNIKSDFYSNELKEQILTQTNPAATIEEKSYWKL
ncbi:hypothetical protein N8772_00640 [Rickettsiales bacterium]|nr:hypothetical protein [Rickettsiales bacterium]